MPDRVRNLQIDLFRGIALISIYVDHIPNNPVSHLTIQSLGFFDAAEAFVFISGLTAARVFGHSMTTHTLWGATRVLQRVWTLYVAHVFLFTLFIAEVSWAGGHFRNPMFAEEMNITNFPSEPHIAVLHALTLQFQPTFLDILPLYIVLLLGFIPIFLLLRISPPACLLASFAVWLSVQVIGMSPSAYPTGVWFFNPLAWQFIFVLGMAVGWQGPRPPGFLWRPWVVIVSMAIATAGMAMNIGVNVAMHYDRMPAGLASVIWPLANKTNLSVIRIVDFLAFAHVLAWVARRRPQPCSRWMMAVVRCGQNSLYIFCLSLTLSFVGHIVLVEMDDSLATVLAMNAGGVGVMLLVAFTFDWFKRQQRAARATATGGTD